MAETNTTGRNWRFQDLASRVFGRLTVVSYAGYFKRQSFWLCRCECGVEKNISASELRRGNCKSCGCLHSEIVRQRVTTHGLSKMAEYRIWAAMKNRCYNKVTSNYAYYGGRGITVCDKWRDSFETFLADMGLRPSKEHSIDRKDNDGPYNPENCHWATKAEQASNQRSNHWITFNGKTQTCAEWARELGFSPTMLHFRILKLGWSIERALTTLPQRR